MNPFPLAFSLLNPSLAVAGTILIAAPILIHLLNRRRFKTVRWAAMDYLLAAMKKNRRRLKFEQWLLLAVRCALLALLGLALARPVGCTDGAMAGLGQRVGLSILIIDNSYSMNYRANRPDARTHLDQAKKIAQGTVDALRGGEALLLITAAAPAEAILTTPTYDLQAVRTLIERIEPTDAATDLAGALRIARDLSRDISLPKLDLHLFTDGTRSAFTGLSAAELSPLAAELAGMFSIHHHHLGDALQSNTAIVDLQPAGGIVTTRFDAEFTARVEAFSPAGAGEQTVELHWTTDPSRHSATESMTLGDGPKTQTRALPFERTGPQIVTASLTADDMLALDDVRRRIVDVSDSFKTLIVEGYRGSGPLAGSASFLNLALAPPMDAARSRDGRYISTNLISDIQLGNQPLSDYAAVILTNVAQIPAPVADELVRYVRGGGTLVCFMGDQVNLDAWNQTLLPRNLLPGPLVKQVNAPAGAEGFGFDLAAEKLTSSYLRIFANQPASGLETARVYSYVALALPPDSSAERILDFKPTAPDASVSADPAIIASRLGSGRIIFVATTADPQWTSLPAKPAYVVLVNELLVAGGNHEDWKNLEVGQSLKLPNRLGLTAAPVLVGENDREIPLVVTEIDGESGWSSPPLLRVGIYQLRSGDRTWPIAVNPPAAETDIRTLDNAALRAALGDIEIDLQGDQLAASTTDREAAGDYGWILLTAVALLLVTESLLAMRFGHNRVK